MSRSNDSQRGDDRPQAAPRRIQGLGHLGHLAALVAWRRFPWPGGRGRYTAKAWLARGRVGRPAWPVPTEAGWLSLAWGDDVLERGLYALGKHYESAVVELVRRLDLRGRTVLDVGAHVGFYAVLLARAVGPDGRLVAFEPQPRLAEATTRGLALNGCDWARVERAAVTDRAGELTLHRPADTGRTSAGALPSDLPEEEILRVPAVRLDSWCADNLDRPVDWIKMDIEGAEWLALDGLDGLFEAGHRPNLLIEIHPEPIATLGGSADALVDRLRRRGYRLRWLHDRDGPRPLPSPLPATSTWHLVAEPRPPKP